MSVRSATNDEMVIVRTLFQEYADEYARKTPLEEDRAFDGFEKEMSDLAGHYSPPEGKILLAFNDAQEVTGCVAYHRFADGICEMKRLYVRPNYRRLGHGRLLLKTLLEEAKTAGYEKMHLDTLDDLKESVALYRSFGFKEIHPYYFNSLPNVLYLSKLL